MTEYKGIEVYKLQQWTQGPVMLQTLNILENFNLKEMGYNSTRYIHTLYQAMNLAFADRDFYYGDPSFPPEEPMQDCSRKIMQGSGASLSILTAMTRHQAGRSLSLRGEGQSFLHPAGFMAGRGT
jgi:gamma-glutamyltranspeptidase